MAVVYSHEQSAAANISRVRSSRGAKDASEIIAPLPSDERTGGISSGTHVVSAAEDTAGTLDIQTGVSQIESHQVEVYSAAGAKKDDDQVVTFSGGVLTVADGAVTVLAATDVIHWSVKGK